MQNVKKTIPDTSLQLTESLPPTHDTLTQPSAISGDSLLSLPQSSDSTDSTRIAPNDSVLVSDPSTAIDTSGRVWDNAFWEIRAGWEFGAMPLFDQWVKSLPSSIKQVDDLDTTRRSNRLTFTIQERPNSYSVTFPLALAYTRPVDTSRFVSFALSFIVISKEQDAYIELDTTTEVWRDKERLSFSSFSLGTHFLQEIPRTFLTVSSVEKVLFAGGITLSPLTMLHKTSSFTKEDMRSFGVGVSWQAGFLTFRPFAQRHGLEAGIYYTGSWYGRFREHGHTVKNSVIAPSQSNSGDPLSFVTHRVMISVSVMVGKNGKKQK